MKLVLKIMGCVCLLYFIESVPVYAMKDGSCEGRVKELGDKMGSIVGTLRDAQEHDEQIFNQVASELNAFCVTIKKECYNDMPETLKLLFAVWFGSFVEKLSSDQMVRNKIIDRLRRAAFGKGFERKHLVSDRFLERECPETWDLCNNYLFTNDPREKEGASKFAYDFDRENGNLEEDRQYEASVTEDGRVVVDKPFIIRIESHKGVIPRSLLRLPYKLCYIPTYE